MNQEAENAVKITASLYPEHTRVVREFAQESHRTFSNALQFIINDWVALKRVHIAAAAPHDHQEQPA
jgi:hypothetical protein